ncbi:uncharacterized protein LOC128224900 [Mya arenaria]|nr:uncharacterized protein LOC128224900 [Mya arenaria]
MQCVDVAVCDTKRSVQPRDTTTHCCRDNFCNSPEYFQTTATPSTTLSTPTTVLTTLYHKMTTSTSTYCSKDVVFILDETIDIQPVKYFMRSVIHTLKVGNSKSLVALFNTNSHHQLVWPLNGHTSKESLVSALDNYHGNPDLMMSDPMYGIHAYLGDIEQNSFADRTSHKDGVILITSRPYHPTIHFAMTMSWPIDVFQRLHHKSDDVIAIGIGSDVSQAQLLHIATTNDHVFQLNGVNALYNMAMINKIVQLIC